MVQIHTPQPVKIKNTPVWCIFLFYVCWVGFDGSTAEIRRTAVRRFATGKNFQVAQQIHTPQPVKIKNTPMRCIFYFTCVGLDLNHINNMVQPPKPGGRQYAGLPRQKFPGDAVNPPPINQSSIFRCFVAFFIASNKITLNN